MQLTLLDDDEAFSPLLELLVPFSISQRLPSVGLPRAARAPRNRSRRRLKSGNEKDDRLRRMLLGTFHFADCNFGELQKLFQISTTGVHFFYSCDSFAMQKHWRTALCLDCHDYCHQPLDWFFSTQDLICLCKKLPQTRLFLVDEVNTCGHWLIITR